SKNDFSDAASFFYNWATSSAFDAVALGPDGRSYADAGVKDALGYSLDTNIDYLSQFPAQRFGLPALSGQQLPNPQDWAVSARAFAELMSENPGYVTATYRQHLGDLIGEGQALHDAIAAISVSDDAGTGTGSRLFNLAIANYRDKANRVTDAIQAVETEYLGGLKGHMSVPLGAKPILADKLNLNLWGGADQTPDESPTAFTTAYPCGATTTAHGISLPSNGTADKRVPAAWVNAMRLSLGDLGPCYAASFTEEAHGKLPTGNPDYCFPVNNHVQNGCVYHYDLTIQLNWEFTPAQATPKVIDTLTVIEPNAYSCAITSGINGTDNCLAGGAPDPYPYVADTSKDWQGNTIPSRWEESGGYKSDFEASAAPTDGGNSDYVHELVNGELTGMQKQLYACIVAGCGLGGGSLSAGAPHDAATALDGGQELIVDYAALGLSRALRDDDVLRALVDGSGRLMDGTMLANVYTDDYNKPPATDPFDAIKTDMTVTRPDHLAGAIGHYIGLANATDSSQLPETSDLVESTLSRLQLTAAVLAYVPPAKPGGSGGTPSPTPSPTPTPTPTSTPTPTPTPTCCSPGPTPSPLTIAEQMLASHSISQLSDIDHLLGGTGNVYLRGKLGHTLTLGGADKLTGAFVCGAQPCRVTIASAVTYHLNAHATAVHRRRHHGDRARQGRLRLRPVHLRLGANRAGRFTIGLTRGQLRTLAHRRGLRLTVTFTTRTGHSATNASHSFRLRVAQPRVHHGHRRHHRRGH
ncbi:MAG: hypothetical protein ACRDNJ_18630, partial [Solirubrobacteraceae bacterium]